MDNKKDMLDIKGTIVPWALPREKIPVHVELPKNLVFDEIHIKVPYDFEFVDFLNVDEVIIEKELAKITKVMRPTLKDVPMYFGFVIVSTKIPEEIKIVKRITIEFIRNNEVINALNLIARIFRPKIEITKSIEKIELVDDQERFNAPINLKYIGFGDIKLRIEAEIGGRIVSHGESIIYELLRRLWLSEVIESENKKEKEKTKKKVHVKPDFIREISEQLEKKIESEDLSRILTMIDEEDIEDFKRWLSEIKNRERFMEVMYSRIEDLLLDLLAELLERHPTENVKLASSRTKVKAKIELPMEIITIRLRYTDSLENEYSSVEISIKIEDKRMKKKGAIIEIPIIIEKWEEEPLMNVAEMIVAEGKKMSQDYEKIVEALRWIDKAIDYLRAYKPETKSMTINYKTRGAEIELVLYIPDNLKRKLRKVEIPAYQNFVIDDMRDESFTKIGKLWQFRDNKWIFDPTWLPSSERYLLTLKGKLSDDILRRIVYVQPAANKDRTEEVDRYWLRSMIRSVESIEKLWDALNVDEVSARVRIGIERYLSTNIPKELKSRIEVTRKWIQVGRSRDRQQLYKVWGEMRRMHKTDISVDEIVDLIDKLTDGSFFSQFVLVDDPYTLGDIRREETFKGTFPERMQVEACTCLTLKQPTAAGYLTFKKKDYTKSVEEKFSDVV